MTSATFGVLSLSLNIFFLYFGREKLFINVCITKTISENDSSILQKKGTITKDILKKGSHNGILFVLFSSIM